MAPGIPLDPERPGQSDDRRGEGPAEIVCPGSEQCDCIDAVACPQHGGEDCPRNVLASPLLEVMPCAVVGCDVDGRLLMWNRAASQLLGWERDEVIGRPCKFVHSRDQQRFEEIVARAHQGHDLQGEELLGRTKEGRLIKIQLVASPMYNEAGACVGILAVLYDTTVREEIAETELIRRNRFIQTVLDNLPIGLAVNSLDKGSLGYVNPRFLDIYGGVSDSEFPDFESFYERVFPDPRERQKIRELIDEGIASGDHSRMIWDDIRITGPDGRRRIVSARNIPLPDQNLMISMVQDETNRKLAEQALRESERRYQLMSEASPVGIFRTDLRGRCRYVNRRWREIAGMTATEALEEGWGRAIHLDERDEVLKTWDLAVSDRRTFQTECRFQRRGGTMTWVFVQAEPVYDTYQEVTGYIGTVTDISDRKRTEEEVRRLAYFDGLTDLPNRAYFMEQLERALATARRSREHAAVLFCDLDNFKDINDSLGHDKGDMLLKSIAERLTACTRKGDTLSRLGGDEFVLLLPSVKNDKEVVSVARKIQRAMTDPFALDGKSVFSTTSIGIAVFPDDGHDVQALLKHADMAMYVAKGRGRNRYQFFSEEMNRRMRERMELEAGLRGALVRNEFFLEYQPQFDLASGRLIGAEALLRWRHPERGRIAPRRFIPLAEETGLIHEIGDWALRESCRQCRAWLDAGEAPLRVAVNLSGHQFVQGDLVQRVRNILDETGLEPEHLELEITESILMKDADAALDTLSALRADGVHLAIDDFGTGYSSLVYLKQFPVDRIKIAREFVKDVDRKRDDAAIVETVILMARNLGLEAIAEGVETEQQAEALRKLGCPQVQGYHYARPMDAERFRLKCMEARSG